MMYPSGAAACTVQLLKRLLAEQTGGEVQASTFKGLFNMVVGFCFRKPTEVFQGPRRHECKWNQILRYERLPAK